MKRVGCYQRKREGVGEKMRINVGQGKSIYVYTCPL